MPIVKVDPTGCRERRGVVQIPLSMYLNKGDYGYDKHYVQVPVMPPEGYTGEIGEAGSPVDTRHHQDWLDSLPKIWQLNPFHNHFIYVEPEVSDEEIMAQMQFHLPNFYAAWCARKPIRAGWDVKTRIRPKRYDKLESLEVYLLRKARCQARVGRIKSFLAQIVTTEKGETFPATAIDIGPGAIDRGSGRLGDYTIIEIDNPANGTGTLDTFEAWAVVNITGDVKIGTFSGSGTSYTSRDVETVGAITAGSKQTFSGLDCDVVSGDFLGFYFPLDGQMEGDTSGEAGVYYKSGDQFGAGAQTYTLQAGYEDSIYGTGETVVVVGRSYGFIIG